MLKKILSIFTIATVCMGFFACNSNSEEEEALTSLSNTMVTSFSIVEDDDVLDNLDSVYFTIDQLNAKIYNADSLPYGTNVSKLVVLIEANNCSVADLYIPRKNDTDTIISYIEHSTDSLNFSLGTVRLRIVSANGQAERTYSIDVNVHKTKPDSLYWNTFARRDLPSAFYAPTQQKTTKCGEKAYCLTSNGSEYCIAVTDNPYGSWDLTEVNFGFTPDVNSFNATDEALFILDNEGDLYTSTDITNWTSCNVKWISIYGGYNNTLLGVEKTGDEFYHVTYPASTTQKVAKDCPVAGTSQLVITSTKWSNDAQAMFIGGQCADGSLSGSTWAYDGNSWAKINNDKVIPALKGMTLFAYYTYKTNTDDWSVTKYDTWVAMAGQNTTGTAQKKVYISLDQGIHWKLADDLMQLPNYIPEMCNAQALVFDSTIKARSAHNYDWEEYATTHISRATKPVTEWECPYIYLFGGESGTRQLYNSVWRGVINRLSYKPVI